MIAIKKHLTILMILLSLVLLLAGCSKSDSSTVDITNKQTDKTTANDNKANAGQNSSVVFGKVESIDGNKFTIALAQHPERKEMPNKDGSSSSSTDGSATQGQPPQDGTAPQPSRTGEPPAGGPGGNGGAPPGNRGTAPEMELTGEKQVIIVADDTVIESGRKGNPQDNSESANEIELTDIKTGMIVQITLKADSTDTEKTAATIRVMSQTSQQ